MYWFAEVKHTIATPGNRDEILSQSAQMEVVFKGFLLQMINNDARNVSMIDTVGEFIVCARQKDREPTAQKTLCGLEPTARLFFTWLSGNQPGYKKIKQAWVKTIKVKRLSDVPKTKEAVTLEEILAIAACPARTLFERRARAAAVFLYLSGMRIGAFVSLPIQAVDIPNRKVIQYPTLGVRTKNRKYGITYLLDIPELLKVVQDWDNEIRSVLSPKGLWFAPLSPETGKIDPSIVSIGEHRSTLARRNIREFMVSNGLPYHSPHKFRHGHIHYGLEHAKDIADFKAVSLNAMHSK